MLRSRRKAIAAAGILLVAAILAGAYLEQSSPPDSDYFGPNEPTWVRVPTTLGDPVFVGVLVLHARPGDVIELDSLIVEKLEGDAAITPIARVLKGETQILGGIAASDLGDAIDLSTYVPMAMLRFTEADGAVELAVRVSGSAPIHGFNGLRLRFTIDGARSVVEDRIPMRASICTGASRPEAVERCRPIEEQMRSEGF